ncbi:5-dehydro-4-deoxy-D-glucuronate isomerase [Roseibium salinum]|nr:5-dehydro-4-deoxy-D-glucuronate isomerase [Roseibium salinum]
MTMRVLYGVSPNDIPGFDTKRLRAEFLVEGLFTPGALELAYTHVDRMVVGAACPAKNAAHLRRWHRCRNAAFSSPPAKWASPILAAREGSPWTARDLALANRDILYVGRGAESVSLTSDDASNPARFYMNSVPAGRDIPHRLITSDEAKPLDLGEDSRSNKRRLKMYIHPEVAPSCLLLMGITDLAPGSIWNTMPPHLHERRMEAYCYF